MDVEQVEISWSVGGRRFTLFLDAQGVPSLGSPSPGTPTPGRSGFPEPVSREANQGGPPRKGRPWSEDEEEQVRDGFLAGQSASALAKETGRSRGAVQSRLVRMGLLTEEEAGLRYPVDRAGRPGGEAPDVVASVGDGGLG